MILNWIRNWDMFLEASFRFRPIFEKPINQPRKWALNTKTGISDAIEWETTPPPSRLRQVEDKPK